MRVLVVDGAGRGHALAWLFLQSGLVTKLFAAPGNPGFAALERCECVPISARNRDALVAFAKANHIDLVVIGPEDPICIDGLSDALRRAGIAVFAPSKAASRIESSKSWALRQLFAAGVPTVEWFRAFTSYKAASKFMLRRRGPMVVKADGLAAGKGVSVCDMVDEALQAADRMLNGRCFGGAGSKIVITEHMGTYPEVSYMVIAAGRKYIALPATQDYKRQKTGGKGPNTGGMGSTTITLSPKDERYIKRHFVQPILDRLADIGCWYYGCLYIGLMMIPTGPRVVEINGRFGDTEMETLALVLNPDDFVRALWNVAHRYLETHQKIGPGLYPAAASVVQASEGYPEKPIIGWPITGIKAAEKLPGVKVFQAGTRQEGRRLVTAGGRVTVTTAGGADVVEAVGRVYAGAKRVKFKGAQKRSDIGWQEIARQSHR